MAVTVNELIQSARNEFDDRLDDHLAQDDSSAYMDGTNKRFVLVNRNVVETGDGAPADLVAIKDGAVVAPAGYSLDAATGVVTFTSAPSGTTLEFEYYFVLITTTVYTDWTVDAAIFIGVGKDPTQITDLAMTAASTYMTSKAAQKMSNKTGWWYSANAGNKSFNKDAISAKFREMARQKDEEARKLRADIYTRQDQSKAPAVAVTNIKNVKRYMPRR